MRQVGLYTQNRDPITGLTANQRQVLTLKKDGVSQSEIAKVMSLSRQRVSQIVKDLESKGFDMKG